jgi:hypothetical protein
MVRLFSALLAVAAAASVLWLSVRGAEGLLPFIQAHALSRWFVPACNLFVVFCLIVAGIKMRRSKRDEDVPLTPVVRRLPSGLRETLSSTTAFEQPKRQTSPGAR